jgi:hypothetical protein
MNSSRHFLNSSTTRFAEHKSGTQVLQQALNDLHVQQRMNAALPDPVKDK